MRAQVGAVNPSATKTRSSSAPTARVAWRCRTTPRPGELTPYDRVLAALKTSTAI